tara:strand:- start:131 stop:595 length:465 start_codon:yes stop_codon:yes gene_type:complete
MIKNVCYTQSGSIQAIIDDQELSIPDDMANRHRRMIADWEAEGNTISPYVAPEPVEVVGTPSLIATGVFAINDGVMTGMETAVGISAAFPVGPGMYWIFFTDIQPNLYYSYNVSASSGQINVKSRDTMYVEISATDDGVPTDPVEISVQVARVK